ncbi:MAG: hypothetical protein WCW25_04975 [Patescibacteria group bacterium]|jgi:hypothetical protein
MKNYAKVGGKKGKPAYRTPASFIKKKVSAKMNICGINRLACKNHA